MLFLGTRTYPKPGEYQQFMSRHGGSNNAWTGTEFTNFFFEIDNGFFEAGLDRFSQFFICPTFAPEWVDKERNAVDSEYRLKLQDDVRRSYQVHKETVNPAHPCGVCPACRAGRSNLCEKMVFLGSAAIFPHIHGFFREHFVMNEAQLTAIDEDVSLGEIACAEPLSVGLHAVRRAGVSVIGRVVSEVEALRLTASGMARPTRTPEKATAAAALPSRIRAISSAA